MKNFAFTLMVTCLLFQSAMLYVNGSAVGAQEKLLRRLVETKNEVMKENAGKSQHETTEQNTSKGHPEIRFMYQLIHMLYNDTNGHGRKKSSKEITKNSQNAREHDGLVGNDAEVDPNVLKTIEDGIPGGITIEKQALDGTSIKHEKTVWNRGRTGNKKRHYMTPLFLLRPSPQNENTPELLKTRSRDTEEGRPLRDIQKIRHTTPTNATDVSMRNNAGKGLKNSGRDRAMKTKRKRERWFAVRQRLAKRLYGLNNLQSRKQERDLRALVTVN